MDDRQFKEKKFWDKFAKHYDLFIEKTLGKTYKIIIENLEIDLNEDCSLLEIGTGTGIIPFSIFSKVSSIVGTDISEEMIRIASQNLENSNIKNISFQVQDSYNLTFSDKSFDIVLASNLLHLLYEPEKAINEVNRVMKDNGILIAPTFCWGENVKSKMIASVVGVLSGFKIVHKWTINEFKNILTSNGLLIDKAVRIDGKFPLVYVVMKKNSEMQ
jgi:phosphatidylethanolamine/phosphatidyl-N-methylethanolamine N-methyltransferase